MPLSKNIHTFSDIAEILTAAVAYPRITYDAGTRGKAVRFVQRCYQYRLLLQAQLKAQSNVKGFTPPTPFDRMKISYEPGVPSHVILDFDPEPQGEFILPSGERVPAKAMAPIPAPTPEVETIGLQLVKAPLNENDSSLLSALEGIMKEEGE